MALSNAERQRRHYEKQKEARKKPGDITAALQTTPFFEFYGEHPDTDSFELPLQLANLNVPVFADDGPAVFPPEVHGLDLPKADNSIERAELIVASLIDAAAGLASIINEYKRKEIVDRIDEIETGDLTTPEARKQALNDIVQLKRMLQQLDKQVRWTFPQWKVLK
ncbi:hypothetical protein GCM10011385_41410 [Nitratireductor aestuarii]|uniref:Uncharacterized protein n=1 Tax=Nitratireductor aestuarii TaxID=1735103 RepID=A0A916WB27_9HYPH|nr:hypothetical protein [Nitratireductor aestuarii]GGA82929.1 hypothetical protein GCM10011385_41410 [Nitratireductor aestuarii]